MRNCLSLLRPYIQKQQGGFLGGASCGKDGAVHGLVRSAARSCQQPHQATGLAHAFSTAATPAAAPTGWKGLLHDYKQLSKARLSMFVMFSTSAGFVVGSGDTIDWPRLLWTSLGTFGAAACANTLNQIYEVSNDKLMKRTMHRPLPAGRLGRLHALGFAAVTGAAGVGLLEYHANHTTAMLGLSNIALYAAAYTPLKQVSVLNTWVGAVVGAIPPLMGWASAAGQLEPGAYVLGAGLLFWQMPHFLSLAWMCKDDYARGGFRMLSTVDAGGRRTALAALRHCAYLLPLGFFASCFQVTSPTFAYEAAALAGLLSVPALRFVADPSTAAARTLFKASLLYLPLMLAGAVAHRLPNHHAIDAEAGIGAVYEACSSLAERLADATGVDVSYTLYYAMWALFGWLGVFNVKCPSKAYGETKAGTEADDRPAAQRAAELAAAGAGPAGGRGDDPRSRA